VTTLPPAQSDPLEALTVMADPADFTARELARLDELGFAEDHDNATFTSFRFGSA
jgi:hypothetical protein